MTSHVPASERAADTPILAATAVDRSPDAVPPLERLTRRRVLHGAAGLGVLGVTGAALAACGGEETPSGSTSPSSSAGGSSASGSSEPAAAALAATADVPVGGGVVFETEKVVLTQPTAGDFKAFSAVCTHQGCTVASVTDNVIACPCHGSMFDAATGEVVGGPAKAPLPTQEISVDGDQIMLA